MKCVLCKVCEATHIALDRKLQAWFNSQINAVAYVEDEAGATALREAFDLLKTNPEESFRRFLILAEQGSVYSMGILGRSFECGRGTKVNLVEAEKWYRRAYEGGSDYGLICLGLLYERSGHNEKAQQVYRTGVERGFILAFHRLASCFAKSPNWSERRQEAFALLEHASAAGDFSARRNLANMMARGRFGIQRIPEGICLVFNISKEASDLVADEVTVILNQKKARLGFVARFIAQFSFLGTESARNSLPTSPFDRPSPSET